MKKLIALLLGFAVTGALFAKEVEIENKVMVEGRKMPITIEVYKKIVNGDVVLCEKEDTLNYGRDKDFEFDCAGIEEGIRKAFTTGGGCCDAIELAKIMVHMRINGKTKQVTIPGEEIEDDSKFIITWEDGKLHYTKVRD